MDLTDPGAELTYSIYRPWTARYVLKASASNGCSDESRLYSIAPEADD